MKTVTIEISIFRSTQCHNFFYKWKHRLWNVTSSDRIARLIAQIFSMSRHEQFVSTSIIKHFTFSARQREWERERKMINWLEKLFRSQFQLNLIIHLSGFLWKCQKLNLILRIEWLAPENLIFITNFCLEQQSFLQHKLNCIVLQIIGKRQLA